MPLGQLPCSAFLAFIEAIVKPLAINVNPSDVSAIEKEKKLQLPIPKITNGKAATIGKMECVVLKILQSRSKVIQKSADKIKSDPAARERTDQVSLFSGPEFIKSKNQNIQ